MSKTDQEKPKLRVGDNLRKINNRPTGMGMEWTRTDYPDLFHVGNWIGTRNNFNCGFETNGDFIFSTANSGIPDGPERDLVVIKGYEGNPGGKRIKGRVGIGTLNPQEQLQVNGNVVSLNILHPSDERLKTGIEPLRGTLTKIKALNGVSYEYVDGEATALNVDRGRQLGLLAQQVERVFPELVKTYEDGIKAVNYSGLIPVLLEGLKEQQQAFDELQGEVEALRTELRNLKAATKAGDRRPRAAALAALAAEEER